MLGLKSRHSQPISTTIEWVTQHQPVPVVGKLLRVLSASNPGWLVLYFVAVPLLDGPL